MSRDLNLTTFLAGEVVRLTWQALALETLLEAKGLVSPAELQQAVARAERDWADMALLEGLADDTEIQLVVNALRARGWRPPRREADTA
jgi:hypothetical protein